MSVFDEYLIAYRDRSDISDTGEIERMILRGAALTTAIILEGKVSGTWKKVLKKNKVEFSLNPFRKLNKSEEAALEAQIARYGAFIGIPAVLIEKPAK